MILTAFAIALSACCFFELLAIKHLIIQNEALTSSCVKYKTQAEMLAMINQDLMRQLDESRNP